MLWTSKYKTYGAGVEEFQEKEITDCEWEDLESSEGIFRKVERYERTEE